MRYRELDIARGFTVLLMPAVHVTMLYGNAAVYNSWWGYILNWVATMPGAQLFMLLMGMSFSFNAHKQSPSIIIKKTGRWLLLSYALNFCKFIIPALCSWLPPSFYCSIGIEPGIAGALRLLFVGDILQLAAISLVFILLIYRQNASAIMFVIVGGVVIILSPFLWHIHTTNILLNQWLSLFTGNDSLVFFPVFPWLLYPLAGFILGRFLQKRKLSYTWLFFTGIAIMLPECLLHGIHFTLTENLYRPMPLQAVYHLGFCFAWLSCCTWIDAAIRDKTDYALLSFCSKHITLIYCIQWVLIFWCIAITPYRGLSIIATITMSCLLSVIIFLLVYSIAYKNKHLLNNEQHG